MRCENLRRTLPDSSTFELLLPPEQSTSQKRPRAQDNRTGIDPLTVSQGQTDNSPTMQYEPGRLAFNNGKIALPVQQMLDSRLE